MTTQGSASGRFTRAINQRSVFAAEIALREMGNPSLLVALDYLVLLVSERPEKYALAALRWHRRFELEATTLTLAESQLALSALVAMGDGDAESIGVLRRLVRKVRATLLPRGFLAPRLARCPSGGIRTLASMPAEPEHSHTVAVLLGAGASVDAGIPHSLGMTDALIDGMGDREHVRLLEFIRHTLAADIARRKPRRPWDDPGDVRRGVDVERLFAAVELLIDRRIQAWSPFVASWVEGLESFSPAVTISASEVESELGDFASYLAAGVREGGSSYRLQETRRALAKAISRAIERSQGGDVGRVLEGVRDDMLRQLHEILNISEPERVRYLTPLIDLARKQRCLVVATLNYDLSVERIAEIEGLPCDTGIDTWLERSEVAWNDAEGLHLLKLHGSIDWVATEGAVGYGAEAQLPQQRIHKVEMGDMTRRHRPAIVFGEAGKLRAEGPFLELLSAWSRELAGAMSLVAVGYSFRDPHVNELIARWFNARPDRKIVVLDPSDPAVTGRWGFGGRLGRVNELFPDKPAPPERFRWFGSTTEAGLLDALEFAQQPLTPVA